MTTFIRFTIAAVLSAVSLTSAPAQSTHNTPAKKTAAKRPPKRRTAPSFQEQLQQMRADLQAQIDGLKQQLVQRDAEMAALQQSLSTTQQKASADIARTATVNSSVQQNTAVVSTLESKIEQAQTLNTTIANQVQDVQKSQETIRKAVEEPTALHYKGITIAPGGFLAADSIWRQRSMNADIYTHYNGTPYMNAGGAYMSEWVPSARQTRLSVLATSSVPFGTINGYFEGDFLSAGITSNNLQSNSYTMRIRQAWAQAQTGRITFTAGQMWTLLTEDRKGATPGQEALPLFFDGNLHVGYTYVRQTAFRVQEAFTPQFTLALALENSQYQFSASNAPSNFFFGAPGAAPGLNNPAFNYTNQVSPDVIVKASFDPAYGHYELGGVLRFFRDRRYSGTTIPVTTSNDTEIGGGFVASARLPITSKASFGVHLMAGSGTGRYGASLLPDVTVRPNGTLEPLRNAQGIVSLEFHPTPKLDLFGYAGTEYVQRTVYRDAAGTLVGYAPVSESNSGCGIEAPPTAGTGYAPGASQCLGATRAITQGSVGWQYRIYSGPKGRLQYGAAYSYLTRSGWAGVGGAPTATNNFVYTSFRYFLP
jgi:hypothetical protein